MISCGCSKSMQKRRNDQTEECCWVELLNMVQAVDASGTVIVKSSTLIGGWHSCKNPDVLWAWQSAAPFKVSHKLSDRNVSRNTILRTLRAVSCWSVTELENWQDDFSQSLPWACDASRRSASWASTGGVNFLSAFCKDKVTIQSCKSESFWSHWGPERPSSGASGAIPASQLRGTVGWCWVFSHRFSGEEKVIPAKVDPMESLQMGDTASTWICSKVLSSELLFCRSSRPKK